MEVQRCIRGGAGMEVLRCRDGGAEMRWLRCLQRWWYKAGSAERWFCWYCAGREEVLQRC